MQEAMTVERLPDMRTINDLQKQGYGGLEPTLIKDILYLEQLSTSTSQPIRNWPVIEMLSQVERGNKRAINKLFFEHIEVKKTDVLGAMDADTFQKIETAIFNTASQRRERTIQSAERDLQNHTMRLKDCQRRVTESIKACRETYDRILDLQNLTPAKTMEAFKNILAMPFWQFERFAFGKAYFVTSNDIVMREFNKSAGLDIQVNFGRIRFVLNVVRGELEARAFENNLIVNQYFHPFIAGSGSVCFGTYADTAHKFLIEYQYDKLFELLASLLINYDGSSGPYQALYTFWANEQNNRGKRTTVDGPPCERCGDFRDIDDNRCACTYCEHCEDSVGHSSGDCEYHCGDCEGDNRDCECNDETESEVSEEERPF